MVSAKRYLPPVGQIIAGWRSGSATVRCGADPCRPRVAPGDTRGHRLGDPPTLLTGHQAAADPDNGGRGSPSVRRRRRRRAALPAVSSVRSSPDATMAGGRSCRLLLLLLLVKLTLTVSATAAVHGIRVAPIPPVEDDLLQEGSGDVEGGDDSGLTLETAHGKQGTLESKILDVGGESSGSYCRVMTCQL